MMKLVEDLARQHSKELFSYLCRFTGDHATAEDILSDVFVRLAENINKIDTIGFQFRPWLYKVATNLAISHFRKQKIRRLFALKGRESNEYDPPHDQIEQNDESRRIKDIIEKLDNRHKTVILMRVYQELSYEDIATSLNINIGTVKSRINSAKEKLKLLLEET